MSSRGGEVDEEFDRDFYLAEEGYNHADDSRRDRFIGDTGKYKQREEQWAKSRARGDPLKFNKGVSSKKSQLNADQCAWENNRLLQSGMAVEKEVQVK